MTFKTPLSKQLLQIISSVGAATIDFYAMLHDLRYHRGWYAQGGHALVVEERRFYKQAEAKKVLARLRRAGYVQAREIGKRLIVELTEKGKQVSLAQCLRSAPIGKSTVVIFDVPESQRLARQQLRLLLKQGGFVKLQQSVWVSERDCHALVSKFVKHIKAERWVNVFWGSNYLRAPNYR